MTDTPATFGSWEGVRTQTQKPGFDGAHGFPGIESDASLLGFGVKERIAPRASQNPEESADPGG